MGKFEERNLRCQDTCEVCKHSRVYNYAEAGDCLYCMLGVNAKDRKHVEKVRFWGEDADDRYAKIMRLEFVDSYIGESPRSVESNNVCQFFKRIEEN